jgi:mannose/cellobiose epimerase-like protein (N-acyl-D-glucosamine 2-epimerase family)
VGRRRPARAGPAGTDAGSGPPTPEEVRAVLDRCVTPVIERTLDHEHGGFLVDLDATLRPVGPHRKTLEHAGRTTLGLARLHADHPDGGYGPLVRHGCDFLTEAMWDHDHGGFYALVERDGTPAWDGLKHPHGVTYAARALLLAADVLEPGAGREWARRSLAWLDDVAWDPSAGTYAGSFRRDGTPYREGDVVPTEHGSDPLGVPLGFIEMNTASDGIGMLVDLVPAGVADPARLDTLVERVVATVQPPGVLPYLFHPDWTPAPALVRTGHQFQTVRRLVAAGAVLGDRGRAAAVAHRIGAFGLRAARLPDGSYPTDMGPTGWWWASPEPDPRRCQWWVQLEALDAACLLARQAATDDERVHLDWVRTTGWRTFVDRYVDHDRGGTYELPHAATDHVGRRRGRVGDRPGAAKTHGWKDISHEAAVLTDLAGGT